MWKSGFLIFQIMTFQRGKDMFHCFMFSHLNDYKPNVTITKIEILTFLQIKVNFVQIFCIFTDRKMNNLISTILKNLCVLISQSLNMLYLIS